MTPGKPTQDAGQAPSDVSFGEAFFYWLKLGFVSFGGPAGQIGMMHQELVERRRWISERRFLHALNYCMVLPGPEAQQLATYIGWLMHGALGGVIAGALFVLPSLFILIALTWVYLAFGNVPAGDYKYFCTPHLALGMKGKITIAPCSTRYRIVGSAAAMRVSSATAPSLIGTLKSTRTSARFPLTSISRTVFLFMGT